VVVAPWVPMTIRSFPESEMIVFDVIALELRKE